MLNKQSVKKNNNNTLYHCQNWSKQRGVKRDQYEEHREKLLQRMKSDVGQEKYAKRRAPGEHPFAVIKQQLLSTSL